MAAVSRNAILRLINASQHSTCPCHGGGHSTSYSFAGQTQALNQLRTFATPVNTVEKEYAFEVRKGMTLFPPVLHEIVGRCVQLKVW